MNEKDQIFNYYEAARLLRLAEEETDRIATGRISGSDREAAHLRISHLEIQAIGHALLAGISLPVTAHEEEKA